MSFGLLVTIAVTGLSIAFLHAAIPTHWLPFVLTSRALKWSVRRTLGLTALAGLGHVLCTSLLGFLFAWLGVSLNQLLGPWYQRVAGGALFLFGAFYLYRQVTGAGHVHLLGGHSHGHEPRKDRGPHGGFVVETHGYTYELTLAEDDQGGRFRLYHASNAGTQLPCPKPGSISLTLARSDGTKETFSFRSAANCVESAETVARPHAFEVFLGIAHGDHEHEYAFRFREGEHADHPAKRDPASATSDRAAVASLFMLLTFSPCEGFLPVYLSGLHFGWTGFLLLTATLAVGVVAAMMCFTWLALKGFEGLKLNALERYESGILGTLLCALGVLVIFIDV